MKETNNKMSLNATLNNVSRNLTVAICVGLGLKYTKSPLCLLGLIFVTPQLYTHVRINERNNKDERNEE